VTTVYDDAVRRAYSLSTPAEELIKYAYHNYVVVRYWLARNLKAPPEALHILCKDKDRDVRRAVVHNANITADVLTSLAGDSDETIRWEVAHNPSTPELVKLYLKNPDFAGLTLTEFLTLAK
jgi:hypothetical protein